MEEPPNDDVGTLSNKINQLQKQIQAERIQSIKEKLQRNQKKLQCHTSGIMSAVSTRDSSQTEENTTRSILSSRMDRPLCKFYGFTQGPGDRNQGNQDMSSATSIKIPRMERLPPYTSWIFLDRNQRMADDQSVVGRRRIYYDQRGSEALICSDSEEELTEPDGEKHEFCDAEDRILCMAFEEHGLNEEVLNVVSKYVGRTMHMKLLLQIFTWWNGQTIGTRFHTWRHGQRVGEDEFGNVYYQGGTDSEGRTRRWVIYNGPAEASAIPPGWHGWMHHRTDVSPADEKYAVREWQKPHRANPTGTPNAYRPKGSIAGAGKRPRVTGDYDAWTPRS